MKKINSLILVLALSVTTFVLPLNSSAQGTAFTYQGHLNDNSGPANGNYDLQFTIYDSLTNGNVVAGPLTNSPVAINSGLFTVKLDFGAGVFTGPDRWLEIAARTSGGGVFTTLAPRQFLAPTPYAIMANSASNLLGPLPPMDLAGVYSNAVNLNNGANNFDGTFSGQFFGNSFIGGSFVGNFIGTSAGIIDVWHTGGNLGTTPASFLGTTDNQSLVLKVNGQHAQRYEPTSETPNHVGGWGGNSVQTGLVGVTIGGGGSVNPFDYGQGPKPQPNLVTNNAQYGTIAGGYNNIVGGYGGAILGGSVHRELGNFGVIGGGQFHTIESNSTYAVIGGGYNNAIRSNTFTSVIAGGHDNLIQNASFSFIGAGGYHNIQSNAFDSFIGGGGYNAIGTNSRSTVIGGGIANVAYNDAPFSTIAGGGYNGIYSNSAFSTIGGGYNNIIYSNATYTTIGGGYNNVVSDGGLYSTIAGGVVNLVQSNSYYSVISGGGFNTIHTNVSATTIGGGYANSIELGSSLSTISGGNGITIGTNSSGASIGGGIGNSIGSFCVTPTIAGGNYNFVLDSASQAAIGGGLFNTNAGFASTIPGGTGNFASGNFTLAAGRRAKALHVGSFVWADSTDADFASTNTNQFNIRATGGFRLETGGAAATLNGQTLLSGTVPGSALSGAYGNAVNFNNAANSFTGNGAGLTSVNAATATTAASATILNGRGTNNFWTTTGNSGTSPGANFIGTSDGANVLIKGNFVGVGRSSTITGAEYFGVDAPVGTGTYGGMYINTTGASGLPFYGYATAGVGRAYHFVDGNDGYKWKLSYGLTVTSGGNVGIANTGPTNLLMVNNARCDGSTWINASDRNLKENFAAVNTREILEKVVSLPITKWNYKTAADTHLGPVAQDFHQQFELGSDDKSIATVDESGVALAAIQGLNQKLEQTVTEKDARIGELEKRLAALEAAIQRK